MLRSSDGSGGPGGVVAVETCLLNWVEPPRSLPWTFTTSPRVAGDTSCPDSPGTTEAPWNDSNQSGAAEPSFPQGGFARPRRPSGLEPMSFHSCENPRTGTRGPSKSFVGYQRKALALHPIKSGSLAPQPHSRIDALGRDEPKHRMVYRDTKCVYCNRHFFELGITTHLRVILRRFKRACRRELHHAATDWKVIHLRVPSPAPSPPSKPPPCRPASGRTNHPPCACGRDNDSTTSGLRTPAQPTI